MNSKFRMKYLSFLIIAIVMCFQINSSSQNDLASFAITGLRTSLQKLESVDVQFCEISSSGNPKAFPLEYLKQATYDNILSNAGIPRQIDCPIGLSAFISGTYRQRDNRQFLEITCELPSFSDDAPYLAENSEPSKSLRRITFTTPAMASEP